jgi:hypothetical protein
LLTQGINISSNGHHPHDKYPVNQDIAAWLHIPVTLAQLPLIVGIHIDKSLPVSIQLLHHHWQVLIANSIGLLKIKISQIGALSKVKSYMPGLIFQLL